MKRKFSSSKVEWMYIDQLLKVIENNKIKNMLSNALLWYLIKSKIYKVFEYTLNIITLLVPVLIVLINSCMQIETVWVQVGIAFIGTVAAAGRFFSKIHENRVKYRMAAERIKSETSLYINEVGEYKNQNRDEKFIKAIIEIRENENYCRGKLERG